MEENEVREINKVDGANGGGACRPSCVGGRGAAEVGRREGRVGVEEGPVRPRGSARILCGAMSILCE